MKGWRVRMPHTFRVRVLDPIPPERVASSEARELAVHPQHPAEDRHLLHLFFRHPLEVERQQDVYKRQVLADEVLELVGRDFPEALEARDLGVRPELAHGPQALLLAIAVARLLFIAHAEQRRLQDIKVSRADHVGKELQEKRQQQQPDVHSVHIGIRRYDNLVVAQVVHVFLDIQRGLQQIELLVLVNDLLGQPVTCLLYTSSGKSRPTSSRTSSARTCGWTRCG